MAFCKACGQDIGTANFCPKCGANQTAPAQPVPPAAAAVTAGMGENVAGALCYVLGWLTGIIFLLVDKRPFVKFHAAQSIAVFGGLNAIHFVLRFTHFFLFSFGLQMLLGLLGFVLWIVLMIKAFQHDMFRVPLAADLADSLAR
jgi:uncharacterized membrane protein